MNFSERSIFTDSFQASINGMTMKQLNEARDMIERKITMKAQRHIAAIREAIEAAKADGFNIIIGHEAEIDNLCIITQDDEEGIEVEVH